MDAQDEHALEIRELRDRLGPIEFAVHGAEPTTPHYSSAYEQAALLSSFDPEELELGVEGLRQLMRDCVVVVRDHAVRFMLDPDVRRRVLRQLGSTDRMQSTLGSLEHVPTDPLQVAITHIVNRRELVRDDASIEMLQTAYQALSWFSGIIPTEKPAEIQARIERIGYLDRFDRLVGSDFSGREEQLRVLEDYVGVSKNSWSTVTRALQRWANFDDIPALVITGPGGIGKSTLLVKFILDHVGQFPFVYINFDSPTVRAGDPKTILVETLRQLAIQYPENASTITALRQRWQSELFELSTLPKSAQRKRDSELYNLFRTELLSLLVSLDLSNEPLLFVLDTFEVVQERQRGDIATLYEFLNAMLGAHSPLRVVISGRATLDDLQLDVSSVGDIPALAPIRTRIVELKGLDRATSAAFLLRAGLPQAHADRVADYLIPEEVADEGASPLSLRVAAEIWRRDLERVELDTTFWAQLRAGRIQAQLITRYVRHADPTSLAGQLALPSLLLRRIDTATLAQVSAPAWGFSISPEQLEAVFVELAGLVSLVLEHGGALLTPRPEVQRQVVDLLSDLEATKVAKLHNLAVVYYASASENPDLDKALSNEARFDEIIHRLARGDDERHVRSRWRDECRAYVSGRNPLLTVEAQAILEELAGLQLTSKFRGRASRRVWEGDAVTRARRFLEVGDPGSVLQVIAERDDWEPAGELSLLVARAYLALALPLDALDAAQAAIESSHTDLSSALVSDLYQSAAEASYALSRPQDVIDYTDESLAIAREREDIDRTVSALLLQLGAQVNRDMLTAAGLVVELQGALADRLGPLAEPDELRLLAMLEYFPELVPLAVRMGGLSRLTSVNLRQIARRITVVDEEASKVRGRKPGFLATSAGLSVGSSVTRTWQDALTKPSFVAQNAVIRALKQDVPGCKALLQELAEALSGAVANRDVVEVSTVGHVGLSLNRSRREGLVQALINELGVPLLEAILAEDLDRSLVSITPRDRGDQRTVQTVVETAETDDWLSALIIAARNRAPNAPALLRVANELDLSTIHFADGRLTRAVGERDMPSVLVRLGRLEGQIGRIEHRGTLVGTGLLVSPELLLVASSSVFHSHQRIDQLTVRFGLKTNARGRARFDEGTSFAVGLRGLVDVIPYEGSSGFALLRLEGFPADEPLGSGQGQRFHVRRGFADISHSAAMSEGQTALVCWQQSARLELHVERRALIRARNVYTMPSMGDTSAGAPCFNRSLEFLGLVLENRSRVAMVVPGARVWDALTDQGHSDTVGVPLS